MWRWDQSAGELTRNGTFYGKGYAGFGTGKNSPSMQAAKGIGPIPRGKWLMTGVKDSPNTGPFTIVLEPFPDTQTFGRSAFRIHGDSIRNPGTASHGCIILPRALRNRIWGSGDHEIEVVE
jgi:hypothetical protein